MGSRISSKQRRWLFRSPDELQSWGEKLAPILKKGDVIALVGPLGAGKTTLVQSIAKRLGYRRGAASPTFALVNEYRTPQTTMYHMDMYRLTPAEQRVFPVEEYWPDGISIIEWADRIRDRWPPHTLEITLGIASDRERTIELSTVPPGWQKRLKQCHWP